MFSTGNSVDTVSLSRFSVAPISNANQRCLSAQCQLKSRIRAKRMPSHGEHRCTEYHFDQSSRYLNLISSTIVLHINYLSRSQWPRRLRRGSAAARLLGLWVRVSPRAYVCLLWVLCVVRQRSLVVSWARIFSWLRRADPLGNAGAAGSMNNADYCS
jgi:hypothetical protein